ncbi:uncharacterized protein LOC141809827 [Halichoeres trimaculatus]|uniref:uncharacterized protein LOC141809827 n=1 Tax=Halichoeres trimaculatus TaxID=147232 RepID=UPI003D9EB344
MCYKKCLFLALTLSSCRKTIQGCIEKNITCKDIRQSSGYRYPHGCPEGSKVYVDEIERKIAYGQLGSDPSTHLYLHPDMRLFNDSFVTVNCSDLWIRCTDNVGGHAKDLCWSYSKLTEPETTPVPSESQKELIIGASVGVLLFLFIGIVISVVFRQHIFGALQVCKKKTAASRPFRYFQGTFQNRNHGRGNAEEASGSEEENRLNSSIEAENDNERNDTLEAVEVQSTDPQAAETPDSISQNIIFIEEDNQAKDEGTSVPDEVPTSRDMQRNQRDDPGGVYGIKADDTVGIKKMQNGWAHGGRSPEDDEQNKRNEKEPLLPTSGGTNSDMTGEAAALVDKFCFNPDLDSEHSVAVDTDVKSAHYVKNNGINKY